MKKAKKIAGLILFLAMGFVMFIMISYLLRPRIEGSDRKYFTGFYAAEKESLDIVTLGSSAIYRYFNNPLLWKEYGLTSYNLSTAAQPIQVLENLVDEVHKTQTPQLFIIETRQFLTEDDEDNKGEEIKGEELKEDEMKDAVNEIALKRVTDNMNYSWNRISLINKTIKDWPSRVNYYFDIIQYHDNWETLDEEVWDYADNKQAPKLNGWRNIFTIKEIDLPNNKEIKDLKQISNTSEEVLQSFLKKCKEEKIKVLFVASPWDLSEDEMKQNHYIAAILEENGFDFVDCNLLYEEMGLDVKRDFYNKRHTNVWGSEKFTRYLAEYIQEHYDVKGIHTDSVVTRWNEILENNERSVKRGIANQSSEEVEDIE